MALHPTISAVTQRIIERSKPYRGPYLERIAAARVKGTQRARASCTNFAHAVAAAPANDKLKLVEQRAPNIGIVSAYNEMLSAHKPFETFPAIIRQAAREAGATAQYAGGVPAMCDGVTQGQVGMELSLWSRDIIAQASAIALSHEVFDAALMLGVCDKIVPGLLIGALHFGHIPFVFVPAGPMTSGISNDEKAKTRQRFAQGLATREELLASELASYHGEGTCTFYGTANSNQMLMEFMGLHVPGSAFINPNTPLRDALTRSATQRAVQITALGNDYRPIGQMIDERSIVNAIIGLLSTGGSTNHTLHLVAIARAAGIIIDWTDFDELSGVVPLLARVYPNGKADVNQFHAAAGLGYVMRELLQAGLLHADVQTIMGQGLEPYTRVPFLDQDKLHWQPAPAASLDDTIARPASAPFRADGGIKLMHGNLGRAVFKSSAVAAEHMSVTAPARVFESQEDMLAAFKNNELNADTVVVVRFQGPRANGMPELHKLTPSLAVLQDKGFKVALVTDGRMSGASGKVPAAIHVTPEAVAGGSIGLIQDGDMITVNANTGELSVALTAEQLSTRKAHGLAEDANMYGCGRELFSVHRHHASGAEQGAISWLTA